MMSHVSNLSIKGSDFVLYYRPQDAAHISAVTSSEKEGQTKHRSLSGHLILLLTETVCLGMIRMKKIQFMPC